jgi:hypothetical protein
MRWGWSGVGVFWFFDPPLLPLLKGNLENKSKDPKKHPIIQPCTSKFA